MNAISVERGSTPGLPTPLLRTLAVCDLVDSTALTERFGDRGAAELVHKLDRLTRDLLYAHAGREIDKTDGFLVMFERPVQAVAFALAYQRLLREVQESEHVPLQARIGIHVGDVVLWENSIDDVSRGAKPMEVEGLVKPVAARLMSLALPGQILLSGMAYTFALRAQQELAPQHQSQWRAHGRYQFKGLADSLTVYEIGEPGIAPLARPHYSGKAHREVPWWRRPGALALEVTLLIVAVAVPVYIVLRSPPAIAFADRDWVVVGDLNNLTGEATFNDSVQSAFRIGLEQSRYVNVLSDLKMRDTLALMQRDAKAPVDRTVGSEVAIREGARALILPTLAEIGGRVRFTAEVIDPHTQATVYTESADGSGADSVLPSLDAVEQKLRVRLGEALATVSKESLPLDKVATKNLDALKAYTFGERAYDEGRFGDVFGFYQQAIKLDPHFALAHVALVRAFLIAGKTSEAVKEIEAAAASNDRLGPRDALFIDAWSASINGSPREALERWKMLVSLYPDYFAGQGLYAYFAWLLGNRYDSEALAAAKAASSPRNPHAAVAAFVQGSLFLGNERYVEATRYFDLGNAGQGTKRTAEPATAFAAQRQFQKADETLALGKAAGVASFDISARTAEAAIAIDRGDWDATWKTLALANQEAININSQRQLEFRETELSLRSLTGTTQDKNDLRDYVDGGLSALAKASDFDRPEIQGYLLLAAYLAANQGDGAFSTKVVAALGSEPRSGNYPILTKLLVIAQAETARVDGKPGEAIQLLKPTLDGSELCLTHLALLDAYAANGDKAAAIEQAQWLATHRGRAYSEYGVKSIIPFDVAQTDLALLRLAELNIALGKKDEARRAHHEFSKAWPDVKQVPAVAARLKTVSAAL